GLLEGQELEDRQVDRRMETHAALERADRRTVLHAPGAIDLHLAAVVDPAHAELDHAFGLDQPLDQAVLSVLGKPLEERPQAGRDFLYRLQELRLAWIAAFDPRQKFVPRKPHLYPLSVSMSSACRACGPAVKLQAMCSRTARAARSVSTASPGAARSAVNTLASSAAETAASIVAASASSPSECRSSRAALRIVA